MKGSQKGFTLVELVVVIVILGILAATALPRFINVTTDARAAAVQGIAGGLRSAVAVTQARWFAKGINSSTTAGMADGFVVIVGTSGSAMGVPTNTLGVTSGAGGILVAMKCESTTACQGVTVGGGGVGVATTWRPNGSAGATCQASYDDTTGVVTTTVTGC